MMHVPDCSHGYALWDAAYVLGSLSATDRREFEAHLADCPSCRSAVADLSGMPALLSKLDRSELAAIEEAGAGPSLPATVMTSLLTAVRARQRRTRLTTWVTSAAAAAVLAGGVLVGVAAQSPTPVPAPPHASAPAQSPAGDSGLPMVQVATHRLASTVALSGQNWGTLIALNCVCLAPPDAHHDRLAMVVLHRDGSRAQLATWVAHPGHTATPQASVATPVDQIAAVQVVSADTGQVLLQRSL